METEIQRAVDWLAKNRTDSAKELARHLHALALHQRQTSSATDLLSI